MSDYPTPPEDEAEMIRRQAEKREADLVRLDDSRHSTPPRSTSNHNHAMNTPLPAETPRCDAERIKSVVTTRDSSETVNLVSYDFACGLEREISILSAYTTDGQRTTDAGGWMNYCLEAEKERDELRSKYATHYEEAERLTAENIRLKQDASAFADAMLDRLTREKDKNAELVEVIEVSKSALEIVRKERDDALTKLEIALQSRQHLANAIRNAAAVEANEMKP